MDGSTQPVGAFFPTETAPDFVIAGTQTLKEGASAITVSGTQVSFLAGGSSLVIGGSVTEPLSAFLGASTTTTQDALGGAIETMGAFSTSSASSGGGSGSNVTYVGANTGAIGIERPMFLWGAVMGCGILGVWWL